MTALSLDTSVVAGEEHVATRVDGELVVLNNAAGTYQGLHGIGPDIWEEIQEPTTVRTVIEEITARYDVDRDQCERDVREFLETLASAQLVEIDAQPA